MLAFTLMPMRNQRVLSWFSTTYNNRDDCVNGVNRFRHPTPVIR